MCMPSCYIPALVRWHPLSIIFKSKSLPFSWNSVLYHLYIHLPKEPKLAALFWASAIRLAWGASVGQITGHQAWSVWLGLPPHCWLCWGPFWRHGSICRSHHLGLCHHQLRPTIGSLEHFMKGLPSRERINVPCWQLRKIINSTVPETVGNMLGLLGGYIIFNPGYPKKLMTLELFYLSDTNSRMAIRVAPEIAGLISIFRKPNGVPNEIIRTNSSTWNPFKNNSKGNNHQSGTPQTSGSFSETNCWNKGNLLYNSEMKFKKLNSPKHSTFPPFSSCCFFGKSFPRRDPRGDCNGHGESSHKAPEQLQCWCLMSWGFWQDMKCVRWRCI